MWSAKVGASASDRNQIVFESIDVRLNRIPASSGDESSSLVVIELGVAEPVAVAGSEFSDSD
jgi:hypothetical protein